MDAVVALLQQYGLLVVVIAAFFQGQLVLIGAGILASQKYFSPTDVWLSAACGAYLGHIFCFYFGKRIGECEFFSKFPGWGKSLCRVNRLIRKYPRKSVIFLQYIYGLRLVGAVGFGTSRLPARWFYTAQLLNCLVWAGIMSLIGYWIGEALFSGVVHALKLSWIFISLLAIALILKRSYQSEFCPES